MDKFIGLTHRLTIPTLFVVCVITSSLVLASAPVLDLDADDSHMVGVGYVTTFDVTSASSTDDVLITDSDSNKISRAVITIINPKPGDKLDQNDLEGQLIYDPSSTDTQLIVTGTGPLEKYEAALRTITFSNDCTSCDPSRRFVSVVVEDVGGESSNTAITIIELGDPPSGVRGYIYATVRNAVSLVTLSGAVVSVSEPTIR
jgi:hypothetical protein